MFEHILVPLDGSALAECVLPHLVALAQVGSPRLTLLRVLDPSVVESKLSLTVDPFDWQLRKVEAEIYLREVQRHLEEAGVQSEGEILEGRAAETVLEYAEGSQADLVLMSSHGQSGLSGWNVSSIVQKIILRIHRSVMIVRAYQPLYPDLRGLRYQSILLPLDGSPRAEVVLPIASAIARRHEARLIAAHVVRQPEMPRRTPLAEEDQQLVRRISERNRFEAAQYLEELHARLDVPIETRLALDDNVAAALRRFEENEGVQLVIVSAHGYSGDNTVPYGSVVINFLAYGTIPLLVIQDLPADRFEPTEVERAVQEQGKR
jgi:nucleotide-binding universal stress UspA family protein